MHFPDVIAILCIAARRRAAVFAGRFLPKLGGAFGHRLFFTRAWYKVIMNRCLFAPVIALSLVSVAASAADVPPPCPPNLGVVDRTVGASIIYLGADPANPEICRINRGNGIETFHFGLWNTAWPGADDAARAMKQIYAGPPGTSVTFDVSAGPGLQWHDTMINGGIEDLRVLNRVHRTLRVIHERQGFDGNTYHSIITQWKDIETGMTVYQNYRHIAGQPEPGTSWDPVSITGGR